MNEGERRDGRWASQWLVSAMLLGCRLGCAMGAGLIATTRGTKAMVMATAAMGTRQVCSSGKCRERPTVTAHQFLLRTWKARTSKLLSRLASWQGCTGSCTALGFRGTRFGSSGFLLQEACTCESICASSAYVPEADVQMRRLRPEGRRPHHLLHRLQPHHPHRCLQKAPEQGKF